MLLQSVQQLVYADISVAAALLTIERVAIVAYESSRIRPEARDRTNQNEQVLPHIMSCEPKSPPANMQQYVQTDLSVTAAPRTIELGAVAASDICRAALRIICRWGQSTCCGQKRHHCKTWS